MNNELQTVKIMLEFLQGPIWFSDVETGEPITGIAVIDSDPIVKDLNYKSATMNLTRMTKRVGLIPNKKKQTKRLCLI